MIKIKLPFLFLLATLVVISYSCTEDNCCDPTILQGQWNLIHYKHHSSTVPRDEYSQNGSQGDADHILPGAISGHIIFNADDTFEENLNLVVYRTSTQLDSLSTNTSGSYSALLNPGDCVFSYNSGNVTFNGSSSTIHGTIGQDCSSKNTPLIIGKKIGSDSLSLYLYK